MVKKTFEYYSLNYLNQWLRHDKLCYEILNDIVEGDKLDTLKKAAGHYKVARSLTLNDEKKADTNRYQPVLDQLNDISHQDLKENVVGYTNRIVGNLEDAYGKKLLSATTKFLWLKFRSPNYMYDSQAFDTLRERSKALKVRDLEAFRQAWDLSYNECEADIKQACKKLIDVRLYAFDPIIEDEYFEKIVQEEWFYHRVHDLYLQDRSK